MSGGRSGGFAEGNRRKPAHPEGVSLSQPADRSLSVAGKLLLPSSTGCNVPVSPPGGSALFSTFFSFPLFSTRGLCFFFSFWIHINPDFFQECYGPGRSGGHLGFGSRLQGHNLPPGGAITSLVRYQTQWCNKHYTGQKLVNHVFFSEVQKASRRRVTIWVFKF